MAHRDILRGAGRRVAPVAILASLGMALAASTLPAAANPAEEGYVPTMVVLDASGSMNASDAPGPRIDAAKAAVTGLVSSLPAGAQLGLQVYGTGTGSSAAEKEAGCRDIETLVPVGPVDPVTFVDTVGGIRASGYTPIGAALRAAADALPAEGPRAVVLVSDGIDTCAPPPACEIAAELAEEGVDLTVHTIGFRVDPAARAELRCIADVARGTYVDADSADELTEALEVQVEHAISGYVAEGTPVEGAATISGEAPLLEPGQYVDEFATGGPGGNAEGTKKFYRVEIPEGWTAHVAASMVLPTGADDEGGVALNVTAAFMEPGGSQRCNLAYTHHNSYQPANLPATAATNSRGCENAAFIEIQRYGNLYRTTPATAEIMLRLEPPADATGLAAPEVRAAAEPPAHSATATAVEGGLSFNRATELVPGDTYVSTVVSGEFRYYRVPVTWGQQLAFRLDITDYNGTSSDPVNARAYWLNPLRDNLFDLTAESTLPLLLGNVRPGATGQPIASGSEEPVRYGAGRFGHDGDYYFVFGTDEPGDAAFQLEFLLTVVTPGEIEEGPVYDLSAANTAEPTPAPEASPDDEASPAPETSPVDEVAPSDDARPGADGVSPVVWAGIGGLVVIAVGGVVWGLWRRGQGSSRQT